MKWLVTLMIAGCLASSPALADGFYFGFDVGPMSFRFGNDYWYGDSWYSQTESDVEFDVYLNGYGSWVYLPAFGRVWIPYVEIGWRPYFNGHWVWTSYGWTWIAYEPWGYVPHHFGRWVWDSAYGWMWMPGYEWGPAWVTWRMGGTYVSWAPLPPAHFHYHQHNHYYDDHRHWEGHRRPSRIALPYELTEYAGWTCVGRGSFSSENIPNVAAPLENVVPHFSSSEPGRALNQAPARQEVERWTSRKIPETSVSVARTNINGKSVTMVRPKDQLTRVNRYAPTVERKFIQPALSRTYPKRVDEADQSRSTKQEQSIRPSQNQPSTRIAPKTSQPADQTIRRDSQKPSYSGRNESVTRDPVVRPAPKTPPQLDRSKGNNQQSGIKPKQDSSNRAKPAELRPRSAPQASNTLDPKENPKKDNEKKPVKGKANEKKNKKNLTEDDKKTGNAVKAN